VSGARVIAVAATAAAVGLAATGCGATRTLSGPTTATGTRAAASSTAAGSPTSRATRSRARRHRRVAGPPLRTRQSLRTHGADLTVTVLRVLALSHTGSAALPGNRQVGVQLRIANQAGQTYDSTSSGDVSVVLSSGQSEPLDVRSGPCMTPLVDFESMIGSGDVRTGCVGFSVPRGARVLGVRFSPHAQVTGTLTWRVG
jgi:hypothetical protein